jgi:hypothetical protein
MPFSIPFWNRTDPTAQEMPANDSSVILQSEDNAGWPLIDT